MSVLSILLFLHVSSAIAAVGTNATYSLLLANARQHPEMAVFTLKTIRLLDSRLANPAYVLVLLTGLGMVFTIPFPITTPWILTALALYLLIVALGIGVYAPIFRRQIQLAESVGVQSPAYLQAARWGSGLAIAITLVAGLIVFLMVTKPPLWS